MSQPDVDLVTVIVPVYRTEAYLNDCVASILAQTYPHLEVILVNDGSDDGSPALCDQWAFADSRVRVIHRSNGGLSAARNSGLDAAHGAFITFIDSDDFVAPDLVETLHALALVHGAGIVGCNLAPFDDDEPYFVGADEFVSGAATDVLLRLVRGGRNWEACAKLFRRSVFDDGRRFREGVLFEDLELVPRLYACTRNAVQTKSRLYGYRRRDDGIMGQSRRALSPDLISVLDSNIEFTVDQFPVGSAEYDGLYAAFVLHASSKLEQMTSASARAANAAFIDAYRHFIRRHLRHVARSPQISSTYRAAIALSAISPRAFLIGFGVARVIKARLVPSLRRRAG